MMMKNQQDKKFHKLLEKIINKRNINSKRKDFLTHKQTFINQKI